MVRLCKARKGYNSKPQIPKPFHEQYKAWKIEDVGVSQAALLPRYTRDEMVWV